MKKSAIIILHIGYWMLYMLLVISILLAMVRTNEYRSLSKLSALMFLSPLSLVIYLPAVTGFYTFYGILFNRFLYRRRIGKLILWGLSTALLCGLLPLGILSLSLVSPWGISGRWYELTGITVFLSMLALVHGIIALVMRGFITWYSEIRVKEALQRKNYEVELALIKSQLNPHFLFNTINNIDVLIEKDPVKASAYLNKLSAIMRFMLYESRTGDVPLEKELEYIEKYIELQRIRSSNPNYVQYRMEGDSGNWMIEPMLFIPFIENAFKHAELKKQYDAIRIDFFVDKKAISFVCENRYLTDQPATPEFGGLGNELIRKRLELLYPGRHELTIKREQGLYTVQLTITANEH